MPISQTNSTAVTGVVPSNIDDVIFNPNTRIYTALQGTYPRKPWNSFQSKIHSAWGNLREKVGLTSEVRQIRNKLPELIKSNDVKKLNVFLKHLEQTGETILHATILERLNRADLDQQTQSATEAINKELNAKLSELRQNKHREWDRCCKNPAIIQYNLEYLKNVAKFADKLSSDSFHRRNARDIIKDVNLYYSHLDPEQQRLLGELQQVL